MKLRHMWAQVLAFGVLACSQAFAQGPKPRLSSAINSGARVSLAAAHPEEGRAAVNLGTDMGALPSGTALQGVTLVFSRSTAQQADLDTLLAAQQNPKSALFHQWLTPDQFAARYGVADADIAKTEAWLQSQGFQIAGVPRSRDRIVFNGTAGQIAVAFGTELHRYASKQGTHFAPAGDLSVPASLAPMVAGVLRLSDIHPHRQSKVAPAAVKPAYTSAQTGNHFLTPSDLATMYDLSSTYKAGFSGAGQGIAVIGQTFIDTAPIAAFQAGAGLTANMPTFVLVPNTGVNGINSVGDGDEGESQLDVEYSSGMAPGATIYFVYTGDDSNSGVFDSLSYAISENIAPVITGSYGLCEPALQAGGSNSLQAATVIAQEVQQANAQGQTVIFSSGDTGSTDCYADSSLSTTQQEQLAVDFPGSIPNVTSMGGLQMATNTFAAGNTQYWQSATGSDVISSLLSYVPETAWNEDDGTNTAQPLSSGGGGSSVLYTRPSWQAGVTGIPTGTNRLVPDLALQASIESPGYIYCTSDPNDLGTAGSSGSCTNGLRNSAGTFLTAGGTSFAAPIFAGMMAVLNQVTHAKGQGNINPVLYSLAANTTTYGSAFHDVTTGSNACTAGASYCAPAGAGSFSATAGYDPATGLGSIDFGKLIAAWPTTAANALSATKTVLNAATTTPVAGVTDQISITVAPQGATGTPTGTVQIAVNGSAVTPALALNGGMASYTYTAPTATGSYVVTATYSGDAAFAASTGTVVLTTGNATPAGTFAITAPALTVAYNNVATANVSITPASGYTGTVVLSLSYPANAPTLCYALSNTQNSGSNVPLVNNGQPVPVTLTVGEGTACGTSASGAVIVRPGSGSTAKLNGPAAHPGNRWPEAIAFAGLLGLGLAWRRTRRLPTLLSLTLLAGLGLGLSGCGGNNTTATTPVNTTQNLTVTLSGIDSVNTSITNSTTFTLTIH